MSTNISTETTGWDISGWDSMKEEDEEGRRKAEERRQKARSATLTW